MKLGRRQLTAEPLGMTRKGDTRGVDNYTLAITKFLAHLAEKPGVMYPKAVDPELGTGHLNLGPGTETAIAPANYRHRFAAPGFYGLLR
jgi:hypothetical protein